MLVLSLASGLASGLGDLLHLIWAPRSLRPHSVCFSFFFLLLRVKIFIIKAFFLPLTLLDLSPLSWSNQHRFFQHTHTHPHPWVDDLIESYSRRNHRLSDLQESTGAMPISSLCKFLPAHFIAVSWSHKKNFIVFRGHYDTTNYFKYNYKFGTESDIISDIINTQFIFKITKTWQMFWQLSRVFNFLFVLARTFGQVGECGSSFSCFWGGDRSTTED